MDRSDVFREVSGILRERLHFDGPIDNDRDLADLVPDSDDFSYIFIPEVERRCFCRLRPCEVSYRSKLGEFVELVVMSPRAEISFPVLALPFVGGRIVMSASYRTLAYSRRSVIRSGRLTKYHLVDISGRACRVSWVKIDFSRNGLWHYLRDRVGGVKLGFTEVEKRYSLPELQSVIHGVLGRAGEDIVSERRRECVGRVKSFEELFACFEDAPSDFSE